MSKMKIFYKENLQTECRHENGAIVETDAPKEMNGKGEFFSPTDLFASTLASCMLTLMAVQARKLAFDMKGTTAEVEKEMITGAQRRIGKLIVRIRCPHSPGAEARAKLEKAALECPVHLSLHPDIKKEIDFVWGL